MENQIVKKEAGNVPAMRQNSTPDVLRSDILVPYVVIAQAMSESVKERKAQMGDIVKSTTLEKLGDPDKPVEVIFLHAPKSTWILQQKNKGGKFEYRKAIDRNASNETLPWTYWGNDEGEEVVQGSPGATEWKRVKTLTVFGILPSDIKASEAEKLKLENGDLPDPSKALTPVLMSFRVFSYKAGKEISTFFARAKSVGAPIWRYTLPMSCYLDKNDQGSFYVWSVDTTKQKAVPKEYLQTVQNWVEIVATSQLQAHEEGENLDAPVEVDDKNVREVC